MAGTCVFTYISIRTTELDLDLGEIEIELEKRFDPGAGLESHIQTCARKLLVCYYGGL